jgi:hypothetical protein
MGGPPTKCLYLLAVEPTEELDQESQLRVGTGLPKSPILHFLFSNTHLCDGSVERVISLQLHYSLWVALHELLDDTYGYVSFQMVDGIEPVGVLHVENLRVSVIDYIVQDSS